MVAPAVAALGGAAAKALASYIALAGTDYVINRGAGNLINYAERRTRRKNPGGVANKVARTIQRGYYSPAGQFTRGFISHVAGSAVSKSIKKRSKAKKQAAAARYWNGVPLHPR